jgi:hypothetical protein
MRYERQVVLEMQPGTPAPASAAPSDAATTKTADVPSDAGAAKPTIAKAAAVKAKGHAKAKAIRKPVVSEHARAIAHASAPGAPAQGARP